MKGQAWSMDFAFGLLLFILATLLSVQLLVNILSPSEFENVQDSAVLISDLLMNPGYPEDWNESSVIRLGLVEEGRLNETKYLMLHNISYLDTKRLLGTSYEYYFYFTNSTSTFNVSGHCGYGDTSVANWANNCTTLSSFDPDAKNLVTLHRYLMVNNQLVRMELFVWQ